MITLDSQLGRMLCIQLPRCLKSLILLRKSGNQKFEVKKRFLNITWPLISIVNIFSLKVKTEKNRRFKKKRREFPQFNEYRVFLEAYF